MAATATGYVSSTETVEATAETAATPAGDHDVTLYEASRLTGIPESTLRRHVDRGDLPGIKRGGTWRLSKSVVLEFGPTKQSAAGRRASERGALAALAYPMFDAGEGPNAVVVKHHADPKLVREMFHEWALGRQMEARLMPVASQLPAPTFDHPPNDTWTCCPGHRGQHAMEQKDK